MAVPRPGGASPAGWNDPPLFTYNAQGAVSPRHNVLNKRVNFPLSNTGNVAIEALVPQDASSAGVLLSPADGPPKLPPVQILPPSSSISVHPPVPLLLPSLSPPIDHSMLPPSFLSAVHDHRDLETLPELLERLQLDTADSLRKYTKKVLYEVVDICQDSIQGRSREDVQTRLSLLDDQWRDGKLSEEAKTKLGCLASALKNNDLKQADRLHLALMVDHISEVSQWMVGVKRLINELKLSQTPLPPSSPKKLFLPSEPATSLSINSVEMGELAVRTEDLCIDTDKFSNLKPILMPEMLVPHVTTSDKQVNETEQELKLSQQYQEHAHNDAVVERDSTVDNDG